MKVLIILDSPDGMSYIKSLQSIVSPAATAIAKKAPSTLFELDTACKSGHITAIVSDSVALLTLLLRQVHGASASLKPSIDNYAGSIFKTPGGIEVLIINPLKQLMSVSYGKFLAQRYISKITRRSNWRANSPFVFSVTKTGEQFREFSGVARSALCMSVDIETTKDPLAITCVGFCAVKPDLSTVTTTIECNSELELSWIRDLCENPVPKIFQNGKYDCAYLLRYRIAPYNYIGDTINLFHSWYAELPKDLASIAAFTVRDSMYWKDLAQSAEHYERLLYNGKDCWNTAEAFITFLLEMPDWATHNYCALEFPTVHPDILCEMTGLKVNSERLAAVTAKKEAELAELLALCETYVAKGFNPRSPLQCKHLLHVLGFAEESTADAVMQKCMFLSPLAAPILSAILKYRKVGKLLGTYLDPDKHFKGRALYAINPHGTDTGRQASKEHHFWTGVNIQNQPRGKDVKQIYESDPGFIIAENDLEQAESRGTANISGCGRLIEAVSGDADFHSTNCAAFFGVPYAEIYDQQLRKVINKALRDLAKRVNHGANYCMGASVLLQTMGLRAVTQARSLLGLRSSMKLLEVCEFLLRRFHATYPELEGDYYPKVKEEVMTTRMLRSRARFWGTVAGWTRYCFEDPTKNKRAANSYIAHVPQNLNAMNLNLAFKNVFWKIWYPRRTERVFKLCAQIHDSILYQFKEGHEYLCELVRQEMEIPITITGYDNVVRTFTVPAAIKAGKNFDSRFWSETE